MEKTAFIFFAIFFVDFRPSLKKTFEQYLSSKLNPENKEKLDPEYLSVITHFLSQLYHDNTEIKIFKNLQGYIVYNKNELLDKYKDQVMDIHNIII